MKKIISLFQRNYDGDRLVRDELTPGAEWVIAGEGKATRKIDGTCCLVRAGLLYKRYEVKKGKKPPADFEAATGVDEITGKQQGWRPVTDAPEDKWHREGWAFEKKLGSAPADGTYELVGPKVQGNPEGIEAHVLIRHGSILFNEDPPRTFDGLRGWLATAGVEGIVWHHPDGRMVKIKAKDFGLKRGKNVNNIW